MVCGSGHVVVRKKAEMYQLLSAHQYDVMQITDPTNARISHAVIK